MCPSRALQARSQSQPYRSSVPDWLRKNRTELSGHKATSDIRSSELLLEGCASPGPDTPGRAAAAPPCSARASQPPGTAAWFRQPATIARPTCPVPPRQATESSAVTGEPQRTLSQNGAAEGDALVIRFYGNGRANFYEVLIMCLAAFYMLHLRYVT